LSRRKPSKKGKCCCKSGNILECMSAIDEEIKRVKDCIPHKHLSRSTREKVFYCIVLRDLAILEKKIDKILCELISESWLTDWDCKKHGKSHSDCDSDSEYPSDCSDECESDSSCTCDCCHRS